MKSMAQLHGLLQAWLMWHQPRNIAGFQEIIASLSTADRGILRQRRLVVLVGFSKSGKSTLVTSHPELQQYFRINSDEIHRRLNRRFAELRDNNTVSGDAYWVRQILTGWIRIKILEAAADQGLNIIIDSCNLRRRERQQRLQIGRRRGYVTILVHVTCDSQTLGQRLLTADDRLAALGRRRTWLDLYLHVQRPRYQPPRPSEADELHVYRSGSDSPAQLAL